MCFLNSRSRNVLRLLSPHYESELSFSYVLILSGNLQDKTKWIKLIKGNMDIWIYVNIDIWISEYMDILMYKCTNVYKNL